jgi:ATP adenylyltransferase
VTEWADAERLGGDPDGFERLWTPHRMAYVRRATDRPDINDPDACALCKTADDNDREHLIVHRGEQCYVVLNLYPYNPGHLMVLQQLTGTQGFNIGMNQGRTGGAGIHEHLHQHIVPRWVGDSNFLPIIGQTKALPELLDETWRRVSEAWPA